MRGDRLCGVCVTDQDYPKRVAYGLINQFLMEYEKENPQWKSEEKDLDEEPTFLATNLSKFQNPKEADKILKIQNDLDDITNIMQKNINDVLARGQKLDDLMEKSEDLSSTSVTFYKNAKKTNACCK